jgi:hypothetical protein
VVSLPADAVTIGTRVTCWVQVAIFPLISVAVHVTTVVPIGNTKGALLFIEVIPQLSVAVAVPNSILTDAQVVISAGQIISGS